MVHHDPRRQIREFPAPQDGPEPTGGAGARAYRYRTGSPRRRTGFPSGAAFGALALLVCLAGVPAPVGGYVLEGPHVLQRMAAALGPARTLRVRQRLVLYPAEADQQIRHGTEVASYRVPDAFRSEFRHQEVERVHLRVGPLARTLIDGVPVTRDETRFERYKDLMLFRSRRRLEEHLQRLGVMLEVVSLGRFQDHVAFVLGARYPDESREQLWVDKEDFRPLRWILTPADDLGRNQMEIRYLDWRGFGRVWHPMTVQFYQDGRLVRVIRAERVEVDPSLSEALFDFSRLPVAQRPPAPVGEGPEATEPVSEVQQTIEEFKRIYE